MKKGKRGREENVEKREEKEEMGRKKREFWKKKNLMRLLQKM